jgi:hypothetical protein
VQVAPASAAHAEPGCGSSQHSVEQVPESGVATPALAGALDFDEHAPKHPSKKSREPIADVQRLMPRAEHDARGWASES